MVCSVDASTCFWYLSVQVLIFAFVFLYICTCACVCINEDKYVRACVYWCAFLLGRCLHVLSDASANVSMFTSVKERAFRRHMSVYFLSLSLCIDMCLFERVQLRAWLNAPVSIQVYSIAMICASLN